LPFTPKLTLHGRRLGLEVEYPTCDEAAQNRNIGYNDGDIVLNMTDAIVNRVGPVGLERSKESVAIRKIDFGCTDCCDTNITSAKVV
jgi:hypothetical protein